MEYIKEESFYMMHLLELLKAMKKIQIHQTEKLLRVEQMVLPLEQLVLQHINLIKSQQIVYQCHLLFGHQICKIKKGGLKALL
jgi:hypothetical protein